ncbi:MAG TPA: hypothetical protein VMV23_09340 [Candidatus Nanopelagicaceae bacterium]|nr:hypothetical protein [Candidatus Nanopelagicaceae bacterium]
MISAEALTQVAGKCAMTELELQAKGYSKEQAETATRYALRWAAAIAGQTQGEQQVEVFRQLVDQRLRDAPAYLDGCARAAEKREYGREMKRAARDGQFKRGISDYGPGHSMDNSWRQSLGQAEAAYQRKFAKP